MGNLCSCGDSREKFVPEYSRSINDNKVHVCDKYGINFQGGSLTMLSTHCKKYQPIYLYLIQSPRRSHSWVSLTLANREKSDEIIAAGIRYFPKGDFKVKIKKFDADEDIIGNTGIYQEVIIFSDLKVKNYLALPKNFRRLFPFS